MRLAVLPSATLLLLVACSSDGGEPRPSASAYPQLSAQEIIELAPEAYESARIVTTSRTTYDGETSVVTDERIEVGEDWYQGSEGFQNLFYNGEHYQRGYSGAPWEPAGAELTELLEHADDMPGKLASRYAEDYVDVYERLPDELIEGDHVVHIRGRLTLEGEDLQEMVAFFLDVFNADPEQTPPLIELMDASLDIWLDAASLQPRRINSFQRIESPGQSDPFVVSTTSDYLDINKPLALPQPLPLVD